MDGQMNNVKVTKEMFDVQESQLENMDVDNEGDCNDLLQIAMIAFQKSLIGTFQKLVNKGMVEYEKVSIPLKFHFRLNPLCKKNLNFLECHFVVEL
jgi:hypothetical protein